MSALTSTAWAVAHQEFEAALPTLQRHFRYLLRRRWRDRDELIAEAVACAWKAWRGLVNRGRDPIAVGVTGIAAWAARHAIKGRRIGNRGGGRHAMDIFHRRAQKLGGFRIVSYDSRPGAQLDSEPEAWREWLTHDRRVTPADAAVFRVDFASWLAALPERRRRTAELLAEGHGTLEVAGQVGVTPAAVSQARSWLERSWRNFQRESPSVSN
jgi:DNA-directed RNA polymerase specialized sigma24 family protein